MILAPLRGVTIRCFREVFADVIRDAGFTEAITPFVPANRGYDPLKDRELRNCLNVRMLECSNADRIKVTPQFIGKDPEALRECLLKVKAAGYDTADLNAGCPYPMVRRKGRGSGLLRTPAVLRQMLEVGCETMGPGKFSLKTRLGFDRNDELLALMPMINEFPLRFLTVHARNARQMYDGICDAGAFERVFRVAKVPVVFNGDLAFPDPRSPIPDSSSLMVGRSFVRWLGSRGDSRELLRRYVAASQAELSGDVPVLGRMKELLSYWRDLPGWSRRWGVVKMCRSVDELCRTI